MRNIEQKWRCEELGAVRERALALGAREAGVLSQEDTFFEAPRARLKLRDFGDGRGELIGYRRADRPEARGSEYLVCPVAEPGRVRETLAFALGEAGRVVKARRLLLFRHTRIHLDEVGGLGSFVELETVIEGQTDAEGHAELAEVAAGLGLRDEDRVAVPYVELLRRAGGGG